MWDLQVPPQIPHVLWRFSVDLNCLGFSMGMQYLFRGKKGIGDE
jgi:hypothetical protein